MAADPDLPVEPAGPAAAGGAGPAAGAGPSDAAPVAEPEPVPELFAAQVAADAGCGRRWCAADTVADATRELTAGSNRLARGLDEPRVVGRATWWRCRCRGRLDPVVALHAVHDGRAAYVPVDPAYPADRVAFMLADAAPRLVLDRPRPRARRPDHGGRTAGHWRRAAGRCSAAGLPRRT